MEVDFSTPIVLDGSAFKEGVLTLPGDFPQEYILIDEAGNVIQTVNVDTQPIGSEKAAVQKKETEVRIDDTPISDLIETQYLVFSTYSCRLCHFKGSSNQIVIDHIENIHLTKKDEKIKKKNVKKRLHAYLCGKCSDVFPSFGACRSHMDTAHNVSMGTNVAIQGADLQDGIDFISKDNKNITVVNKTEETPKMKIKCPIPCCRVKLNNEEDVAKHKLCHDAQKLKVFTCPECSETFKQWSLCLTHLWKSHELDFGLFSCNSCNYKTSSQSKMGQHSKIHQDCQDFICSVCLKTFKQKSQLRNHQVYHLRGTAFEEKDITPKWVKKRECDICKVMFSDSKSLKKHVQAVHSKLRPYVCQVCGHCSATKGMLQIHSRQHSGEKPFACEYCPFSTGDHNTLRRHMMRHSGTKKYQCRYCSYSTIQSTRYKIHLKKQHPGQPGLFSCPKCPFWTISEKVFRQHSHDDETAKESWNNQTKENTNKDLITLDFTEVCMTQDEESSIFESNTVDYGGFTIPAEPNLVSLRVPVEQSLNPAIDEGIS